MKTTPGESVRDRNEETPLISSFDILVYAYLKEELVNTPDSSEVKFLRLNFKELAKFVDFMDELTFVPP